MGLRVVDTQFDITWDDERDLTPVSLYFTWVFILTMVTTDGYVGSRYIQIYHQS